MSSENTKIRNLILGSKEHTGIEQQSVKRDLVRLRKHVIELFSLAERAFLY